MDLDDLLEEFKDDHKNAKTGGTNGLGGVKRAKKASQQEDEWGAFGKESGPIS